MIDINTIRLKDVRPMEGNGLFIEGCGLGVEGDGYFIDGSGYA